MALGALKELAKDAVSITTPGYHAMLRLLHGASGPHGLPDAPWANAVLRSRGEVEASVRQVRRLGLPLVADEPKNWDTLAALDLILRSTAPDARVLDAGGELYSMILPWLSLYGYRNLVASNLAFRRTRRRGPIVYRPGDITRTDFPAGHFDAVACLSVIEHGVDLAAYFAEMARITKPGGLLVTSADYFETPIDTRGRHAYGVPIHVFDRREIEGALRLAEGHGWSLVSPLDLSAGDKVVHWREHDLRYTFVVFSLRKAG